jgi:DNA-binding NarL/FixJ family response regulator
MMEAVAAYQPDVALISAALNDGPQSGIQLVSELRCRYPATRCIVLVDQSDREQVVDAFRGGAAGIYSRAESMNRLAKSIRSVHQGQVWASSQELQYLLEELVRAMPINASKLLHSSDPLTDREEQIAFHVAQGYTNREIAERLGISEHTVKNYVFKIFDKLGVSTRVELTRYALSHPDSSPRKAVG